MDEATLEAKARAMFEESEGDGPATWESLIEGVREWWRKEARKEGE